MKYCKVENMLKDWYDVKEDIYNEEMSDEEKIKLKKMLNDILNMCKDEQIINDYDSEELDCFIE